MNGTVILKQENPSNYRKFVIVISENTTLWDFFEL